MIKSPPGPRLTDALCLSGSEPNRAQEEHAKNAKTGSRKCSSPGRGHLAVVFFFRWKNFQKKTEKGKIQKGPRARWDSALATSFTEQTRRNPKNWDPGRQTKQTHIFWEKQKYFENVE